MNVLLNIIKLLPTILAAIMAVEQIVTTPKSGETKKQIVLDSIAAAAKVGAGADEKTVAAVSVLIDSLVVTLNKSGVFAK
jgi:hypothetical protein